MFYESGEQQNNCGKLSSRIAKVASRRISRDLDIHHSLLREGPVNAWLIAAKEHEAMVADITVSRNRVYVTGTAFMSVIEYGKNPTTLDLERLKSNARKRASLQIEGVMIGGGGGIILELSNGTRYMVTVYRDDKAPRYPNTLDSPAGITETHVPIHTSIKEAFEEVIIFKGNVALVPQYTQGKWTLFNGAIKKRITELATNFNVNESRDVEAKPAEVRGPLYISPSNLPVDIGLYATKNEPVTIVNIVIPPAVVQQETTQTLAFRETLSIETRGQAKERDVILMKTRGEDPTDPNVIVYRAGKPVEIHSDIPAYMATKGKRDTPYSPILATTLRFACYSDEYMDAYQPTLSELLRDQSKTSSKPAI